MLTILTAVTQIAIDRVNDVHNVNTCSMHACTAYISENMSYIHVLGM